MEYRTGDELLAAFNLTTREDKLAQAVIALMNVLDEIHEDCKAQSLANNLLNQDIFCSCADAYRMGHAALNHKETQAP